MVIIDIVVDGSIDDIIIEFIVFEEDLDIEVVIIVFFEYIVVIVVGLFGN